MERLAMVAALACLVVGCVGRIQTTTPMTTPRLTFVSIGSANGYLLDPLSETCTLLYVPAGYDSSVAVPVDCARLAANDPKLAAFITWAAPASPAPAPAPAPVPAPAP